MHGEQKEVRMEVLLPLSGHNIATSSECEKRVLRNFSKILDFFGTMLHFLKKSISSPVQIHTGKEIAQRLGKSRKDASEL